MPRYHFNVFDGYRSLDREGTELADWRAAQTLAIQYVGVLLQNDAARITPGEDWHMEVTDDQGLILFRLDFSVMAAPALLQACLRPREDRPELGGQPEAPPQGSGLA